MEKLPGDLVWNILTRLPGKLLAQMRCVSKPWNALLSQPSFIKSHLHRSIHTNDVILMAFEHPLISCTPFIAHRSQSPHLQLPFHFIKLPAALPSPYTVNLVGSVNGLVCLSYRYDSLYIYIWNPSLSASITVFPSKNTIPDCYDHRINFFLRFGFDPQTDDYKVVKITGRTPDYFGPVEEWLQVEVYSMRNQSWELITERVPSHVKRFIETDHVCVDGHHGHVHWLASFDKDWNWKAKTIVAFDLGARNFSLISLPDILLDSTVNRWNVLGVLAGKLCVMSCEYNDHYDCVFEVWVMDEYGVAPSWVKHHIFSQFRNIQPFGFTLHNEFLFETHDNHLALYDPISEKVKLFKSVPECHHCGYKIVVYVDSFVWVAPAKNVSVVSVTDGR